MQIRAVADNRPHELTLHVKYITIIVKSQEEQPSRWCNSGFRSTGLRRHEISPAQALADMGPRRRMAPRASKTAAADTAGIGPAGRRCPSAHRPSARRPADRHPPTPRSRAPPRSGRARRGSRCAAGTPARRPRSRCIRWRACARARPRASPPGAGRPPCRRRA